MTSCNTCPTKNECDTKDKENCLIENNPQNNVKKVIAVMSGKGGVGKSTVAALLAKSFRNQGYKVGVLDADITGPSIPRLLKVRNEKVESNEHGLLPVQSQEGIQIMSLNLLMKDEEQPVIWRGPMISNTVKQFWTDVHWGDLDYLIIDMPPGTGDVALTVMQTIPINGMIMVTTPQDMVSMIVAKSINMTKTMKIPIVGIIENMSYIKCPNCDERVNIFENYNYEEYLKRMNLLLLAQLPMCREIACLAGDKEWNDPEIIQLIDKAVSSVQEIISNKK